MQNSQTIVGPMVVVDYVDLSLPEMNPSDSQSIQDFRTKVTIQAQGEPVIFDIRTPQINLALAFASVYEVATQALIRLEDSRLVLVFDHETRELMPTEETNETIWAEILKLKNKITFVQDVAMPTPNISLDLFGIWSRVKENDDIIARTKLFLKALIPVLSPCMTIRIHGDIPTLPLLAALYFVRPSAYKVEYISLSGDTIVLFN